MFDKFISKDKIIKLANTNSTNEFAADLLNNKDVAEGTIIWAISQTKGKGQKGNSWESEDGKNLTFSLILHPAKLDPSRQFLLNKAISLGVIDFFKTKIDETLVKIKWPNDIYVGKCKIAGILIENEILASTIQSSIVGIGLNINQLIFSNNLPNPTSLRLILGTELDTEEVLIELLNKIEERIIKLYNNDIQFINIDYLNNLLYYRVYNNYLLSGEKIEAMILDISEYGQLIIQKNNNEIIKCNFKEIIFLHD
ncbi:MAG: biotin--[acetyl-CoA-carboxylase] ligase [Bacteroidetes bacterium]|nr:biotin--[acetyl-CoA-carboxylase] ligase [Bacteroidota bacterium]